MYGIILFNIIERPFMKISVNVRQQDANFAGSLSLVLSFLGLIPIHFDLA